MEALMLLTYAALCIVVFKAFRIPPNKRTIPTAVLGGIVLIGMVIFGMNYNFPYTDVGSQVFRTTLIVSQVRGRVQSAPVKLDQMLYKGDVLFALGPTSFQAKVDDLQTQIKAASQDVFFLNVALSQAQAELSRVVAQCDQSRREHTRYREGHAQGAFSDQMVDTRLQTWEADEASISTAQAEVVQARNALDSVVKGKNTTVAFLLVQLQKAQFQLENTVVRAPEDDYVSIVGLRPGTMFTAPGMTPLMTFVPVKSVVSWEYVAAFRQNALRRLYKGEPAELMFSAIPGTTFRGEMADVLPVIGESQFQGQGKLLTTDALNTHGRALVALKVTDPRFAEYAPPQGATFEAAVYLDHPKELSLIRKTLIHMKGWENYLYLDHQAGGCRADVPPRAAVRPRCPPGRQ